MIGQEFHPRIAYRTLRVIFYALNTGLLAFFMVGIYLNGMQIPTFQSKIDILTIVNILLLVSIPAGYTISNRKMEAIDPGETFSKKFELYQTAMIIRWAMIEGTALFSIVGLILLRDANQLIIFLICILAMSMNSISKEKVIRGAKLNQKEAKALDV